MSLVNIKKTYSKNRQICSGVIFKDHDTYLKDIDSIFLETNKEFSKTLQEMGLVVDFDFSNRDNKKLYTHAFLKTLCDWIKGRRSTTKLCFYNNSITKDVFRDRLIKKIKTIFGFKIWDDVRYIEDFVELIEQRDADTYSRFEIFLSQDINPKPFKKIQAHMKKTGLTFLCDEYFKELQNKLMIYNH